MNNKYLNIKIEFPKELNEILLANLSYLPFLGLIDNEDNFIVSFNILEWDEALQKKLQKTLKNVNENIKYEVIEEIDEKNWNEEWEKEVPAIHIDGKIGIAPSWKMNELDEEIKIEINPKMSFGTGNHATTRLCCKLLEKTNLENQYWIDAGTGTGILAILSVKLGAKNVFAFDNNEWSFHNAKENIEVNKVSDSIELELLDLENKDLPEADGITANILAHIIIEHISNFYNSLKNRNGLLIASGILSEQEKEVLDAALKVGFVHKETIYEDEWCGILFGVS